jgi:hypothetical protein
LSPGRRTNRENFRSCQRTSLFLLLSFLESIKNRALYLLENQSSAGHPQPPAAFLVQCVGITAAFSASSSDFSMRGPAATEKLTQPLIVKILETPC